MKNNDGRQEYGIFLDNSDLKKNADESKNIIRGIGDSAVAESARVDNAYKKVAGATGALFSAVAIKQFGMELINITGQFQTFEAVLTNTLQSPAKAKQSMMMLQEFAATTPFQVDALTGAFVKLANQGFVPTYAQMTKLGDLASSTGKGFDQLAEAIIDAQTGEFERLNEFGIRASKEGEKVTFTFKEQKTQVDFTASSIRDYVLSLGELKGVAGANAEIAKTLTGQYSNLQDTITQTMNKIGQSSEGMLSEALSGTTYLVEHYEKIGRVLGVLIASYGTYKAAVIAYAVAQKVAVSAGNIKAFFDLAKGIKTAKDAQIAFNLAMGANPLAKMASILVTVVGLIWAFAKNTSDATDEVTGLNKAMKDAGVEFEKEAAKVEALQGVMNNSKIAYDERKRALTELKAIIPGYNAELTTEGILINNNTEAIKGYLTQLEKQIKLKAIQEEKEEAIRNKRLLEKQIKNQEVVYQRAKENVPDVVYGGDAGIEGQRYALNNAAKAERELNQLQRELTATNKTLEELDGEFISTSNGGSKAEETVKSFTEQLQFAALRVTTLKNELTQLNAGQGNKTDFAKSIKEKKEELAQAEQSYITLLGVDKKYLKEKEKEFEKAEQAVKDMQLKNLNDFFNEEITLKRKQITDKVKLIEFDRDTTIAAIEAEKQAYLQLAVASGVKVSDVDTSIYEKRKQTVELSAKIDISNVDVEEADKIKTQLEALQQEFETYEQERTRIQAEYAAKREKMYEDDGKTLKQGFNQGNLDELNRNESEALKAIDEQFAQRELTYTAWCDQIANDAIDSLKKTLEQAKKELEKAEKSGVNGTKLAAAHAKVTKVQEKVDKADADKKASPGKRTLKEWKDLYETLQDVQCEFDKIGEAIGGAAGEAINTAGLIATSTMKMVDGIMTFTTTSLTAIKAAGTSAAATLKTVEAASVILTVIAAAMQIAMVIVEMFNSDKAYQKETENLQERISQLQWELDNAEAIRVDGTIKIMERMRKVYAEVTQEILKAKLTQDQYSSSIYQWMGGVIYQNEIMQKSAEKLAVAYANTTYTLDKALGEEKYKNARKELENIAKQQLSMQQKIDAENSKKKTDHGQIEELERQILELGAEANKIINEIVEDIIGGSATDLAAELGDAFIEAFQNGEDAAEAWGDKVNEIVANVMKRMLVSKFLEEPLGEIFNKYKSKWYKDGEFAGIDAIMESMGGFTNDLNSVGSGFQAIWENLPDDVKNMLAPTDEVRKASEKGIASASQESVDELNGRMTAVQGHTYLLAENSKILVANSNRVLNHLAGIENNTKSLTRLEQIETDMGAVKTTLSDIALKGIKIM